MPQPDTRSETITSDQGQQPELKRSLSLPLIALYGLGNILGAGIYVLIGAVANSAGNFAPYSFVLAAAVAGVTAFASLPNQLMFVRPLIWLGLLGLGGWLTWKAVRARRLRLDVGRGVFVLQALGRPSKTGGLDGLGHLRLVKTGHGGSRRWRLTVGD